MSLINGILSIGWALAAAEADLIRLGPGDPGRDSLARTVDTLQARQTGQIADAIAAGIDPATITAALEMHGQGAARDPWRQEPTVAEQILADCAAAVATATGR